MESIKIDVLLFITFDHKFEKHKMLEDTIEIYLFYTIQFNTNCFAQFRVENAKYSVELYFKVWFKMQLLRSTKSCTVS